MKLSDYIVGYFLLVASISFGGPQKERGQKKRGNEILQLAQSTVEFADEQNQEDIRRLYAHLEQNISDVDFEELKENTKQSLQNEKNVFVVLHQLLQKYGGSIALVSSIKKLVGIPNCTGILDDAIALLGNTVKWEDLSWEAQTPTANQITVLKTLLLFLNFQINALTDEFIESLQFVYFCDLPRLTQEDKASFNALRLINQAKTRVYIPNAGFVFGGNYFPNDEIRGVDCSSFVAKVITAPFRFTTLQLEQVWKHLMKKVISRDPQILQLAELFEAITLDSKDRLASGDLVVTRKGGGGHVFIFGDWEDDAMQSFIAYHVTRLDNKTKEGFYEELQPINSALPGTAVYLLKCKSHDDALEEEVELSASA